MLKEKKIGLIALCNGHYYKLDSLNETVEGLFEVRCEVIGDSRISKLTPVIRNISGKELVFNKAFVSVTLLPGPYEVYTQYSRWCRESHGHWADLDERGVILTHDHARTTEGNTPFAAVRLLGRPEGIGFHVLPLGDWRIRVMPIPNSNKEAPVQVDLGISDETLAFTMQPGEEWTLPEVIVQHFRRFDLSTGELHQFLRKYMDIPLRVVPVEYNTWLDVYSELDVERVRRQLQVAKEVGCELFVIDAGWFGPGCGGWTAVGDWRERVTEAFHGKMAEFSDEVRAAGLGFGLWVEPERFHATAPIVAEHPEWFVLVPNGQKCYRIDLENPEAYAYEKNTLIGIIEKYGLKYLKTDMNSDQGIDDTGAAHYRYARLFYQMMDEIRAAYPELIIENCASGSLRTDLESIKHFDIAVPSDNGNPFQQMDMLIGYWHRFLPGSMMNWLAFRQIDGDVPFFGKEKRKPMLAVKKATWEEFEQVDFESMLNCKFAGGCLTVSGDVASLTPENRDLLKKNIALFKEYSAFMRTCDGYCLQDTPQFKVLEFTDGDTAIMIMQYLACDRVEERSIYPVGLKPENKYEFNGRVYTGAEILENGLEISMKYVNQHWHMRSEMIVLKPVK